MSFHDVIFPSRLAFGARGGPERQVEIVRLASGLEQRNVRWSRAREQLPEVLLQGYGTQLGLHRPQSPARTRARFPGLRKRRACCQERHLVA